MTVQTLCTLIYLVGLAVPASRMNWTHRFCGALGTAWGLEPTAIRLNIFRMCFNTLIPEAGRGEAGIWKK